MIDKYFSALFSGSSMPAFCAADSMNPLAAGIVFETGIAVAIVMLLSAAVCFVVFRRSAATLAFGASPADCSPERALRCDRMADMGAGGSKPLLLVAEDNMSNYKLLEVILRNEYRLVHALNGEIAVEMFDSLHPNLVLMDINMPVMDGYEAMRNIKAKAPKAVVIALTAYAFESDRQKMLASGFDDFLAKPIKIIELKEMVASHVKANR